MSAKDDLNALGKVCDTYHREFEAKKFKVVDRDSIITNLKDENATAWAKGYFVFQKQSMKKYPTLDFNFEPFLGEEEGSSSKEGGTNEEEVGAMGGVIPNLIRLVVASAEGFAMHVISRVNEIILFFNLLQKILMMMFLTRKIIQG
ncbi:unnamed protein product [Ilex paraguariensis]|uniref:Uncharacterized protein n=1 Tax=Ilex paraguariensis TaxID=185542 RepID=A0ABC8UYT0_9AQUA